MGTRDIARNPTVFCFAPRAVVCESCLLEFCALHGESHGLFGGRIVVFFFLCFGVRIDDGYILTS